MKKLDRSIWAMGFWVILTLAGCGAPASSDASADDAPTAAVPTADTSASSSPNSPDGLSAPFPTSNGAAPPTAAIDPVEQQRKLDEARAALERNPGDPAAARAFAIALYSSGDREEAVKKFETLANGPNASTRAKLDLALVYNALSRVKDAESIYERLLQTEPDNAIVLHNLGNLNYKRGDYSKSIELYQRAVSVNPNYMLAYLHLGDAYRRQEQFREAYRSYNRVIQIEPTQPQQLTYFDDALYNMASLDLAMGAPQRALQLLQELLAENPEHSKAHYALGKLLLQMGRPAEAEQAFANHMRILEREQSGSTAAMVE